MEEHTYRKECVRREWGTGGGTGKGRNSRSGEKQGRVLARSSKGMERPSQRREMEQE